MYKEFYLAFIMNTKIFSDPLESFVLFHLLRLQWYAVWGHHPCGRLRASDNDGAAAASGRLLLL